ncbi:tRNA (adenine(58)-N(1))-methyltransferase non-catalytic subunit trm6 [Maudiozyma exigua]|uniref:tRNA (adenine(58)-N(1))-methyltransferase non-catalytic subunit TRM6 n=1 Tax=Maudiozyma exigua TaxID=34358 RepID=A0A9P6WBE0_MAUEX|nr:tRNA (adenine(58)-N(1))-methyltransferase non-catalytic subunit trm6 [Kazachstania exigua]
MDSSKLDPLKQIALDQFVIITLPSEKCKIVELKGNTSVSLGKFGAFHVNDIVGYPLGTKFEIYYDSETVETIGGDEPVKPNKKNKITKVNIGKVRIVEKDTKRDDGLDNVGNSHNNKELINLGSDIQKMTSDDIEALKKQSTSANEIISKIIESHGTFDKKTLFSQEKYLKRKKQKFDKQFVVNYLSANLLLQYLIDKNDIQRIMDMSEESIGMLLNLANIRPNGTYLCMDETGGLLIYFLLERMFGGDDTTGATGKIVVVHENEHPNFDLLKYSNYSEKFIAEHVIPISILEYFEPRTVEEVELDFKPLSREEVSELKSGAKNTYFRKLKWHKIHLQAIDVATKWVYDGLVVATTLHLPTLLPQLGKRVHGSRPIVCYSQFKEVLLELSHTLYDDLNYLAPTIIETKCRPYQSIRGRIHPLMTMKGGGGYLLWCHKVIPAPEPELIPTESVPNNDKGDTVEK